MISYGKERFDLVLQPISGKAVPVYAGEVLRIIQVEGEQCVDFNAFNLHDYKERRHPKFQSAQIPSHDRYSGNVSYLPNGRFRQNLSCHRV